MSIVRDLASLSKRAGFRRLLGVRLISQVGDGMFQAGLASMFFFSPQSMTTAMGVASALVVMFLPYSLIGPFTGPLLDRWKRRQVLMWGNIVRFLLVLGIAALIRIPGALAVVYVLVLGTLGLARFMLSGLSAGLPKVVGDAQKLIVANSLVPTLGGIATGLGAIIGFLMRLLLPGAASKEVASLVVAALLYLGAAGFARLIGRDELGPDASEIQPLGTRVLLSKAARDLCEAVHYLRRRGTPAAALVTMALHRFVYYMQLITIILLARNYLAEPSDAESGIGYFGTLGAAMVAGHFAAIVMTPIAHARIEPWRWIVMCLIGGSVGQALIAASPSMSVLVVGIFIFGIGVQGAKIAVDTIVQRDTADEYRGRAFSIYDVMFNLAACVASGVGVLVFPDIGWSRELQVALMVFVWCVACAFWKRMVTLGGIPATRHLQNCQKRRAD